MRPPRSHIRTAATAALCLMAAGTWPALAGEAEPPPPEATYERETEEDAERAEAPSEAPARADTTEKTPDIFVPTEDISEDLSVRFPVDI